ncbi:hypothetical protein CIPAW_15G063200 [Carya illinoinensis]|uniref:Uncharacterized protein n=1 Tax=Carya illinoinensis TaxID=32201 RepID=A0A8T1N4R1_CARIL|nr:hypothetical protein CIPAW_15G063200 [Carya illinoinensis]
MFVVFLSVPSATPGHAFSCLQLHRRIYFYTLRTHSSSPSSVWTSSSNPSPKVVVTRDRGKNGKLIQALQRLRFWLLSFQRMG